MLNDTTIKYTNANGLIEEFPINKVQILSVRNGTYAATYGLVGGGLMLLTTLIAVADANSKYPNSTYDATPLVLGFTGAGILIGALIGSANSKWKRLEFRNKTTSFNYLITPSFIDGQQYLSFKLVMNF